jgi:hypothetical protein
MSFRASASPGFPLAQRLGEAVDGGNDSHPVKRLASAAPMNTPGQRFGLRFRRRPHTSHARTAWRSPSSGSRVGMNSWPTYPVYFSATSLRITAG